MTYLLIRQRCCLCGDGVGTTQLLQLWCHHAAALLGLVQCRFFPAARLSQNSETQTTSRANNITTKILEVRLLQTFKHMPRTLPLKFATAQAVMHVRRSSHVKGYDCQCATPDQGCRLVVFNGATFGAGAISHSLDTKSGVQMAEHLTTMHCSGNNSEGLQLACCQVVYTCVKCNSHQNLSCWTLNTLGLQSSSCSQIFQIQVKMDRNQC